VWWLIAAGVLVLAAALGWFIRSRHHRAAWNADLAGATSEVEWFARVLLPQLSQAGSAQQAAGVWQIGAPRIVALEDHLTQLVRTAPMDDDATRARTLRDAVRSARLRTDPVPSLANRAAANAAIAAAGGGLEAALTRTRPGGGQTPPPPG
jgi:hypothetical protein